MEPEVTSITDRDLQGRQSFSEKDPSHHRLSQQSRIPSAPPPPPPPVRCQDRIVLVPPGSDEQASAFKCFGLAMRVLRAWMPSEEMEDWVRSTVGYGCRKGLKPESPNQDCMTITHALQSRMGQPSVSLSGQFFIGCGGE